MVELPGREEFEAELARRLGREFARVRRELVALLGDEMDLSRVTAEVWAEIETRLTGAVLPQLEAAFEAAVTAQAAAIGIAVDFDLINQRAQDWARRYTYDLVRGINQTNQAQLQSVVGDFFEAGVTMADTRARLAKEFGPVRAEMIAQTEVTRAATEGERAGARELDSQGIRLRPVHQTNVDDRVCPTCGPRHGMEITDGRYPPLHVRCRCWVNYEVISDVNSDGNGVG